MCLMTWQSFNGQHSNQGNSYCFTKFKLEEIIISFKNLILPIYIGVHTYVSREDQTLGKCNNFSPIREPFLQVMNV